MKKKLTKNTTDQKNIKSNPSNKFCTECGEDLDNFDFSILSKDKNKVIKNHINCIEIGKFKGEVCSKMFIADVIEPDFLNEPD